jgi:glucosamine kinase
LYKDQPEITIVQQHNTPVFFMGIDGGGSQCRASLYDHNQILLGRGLSGSANPVNGLEQATSSILTAIEQAIIDAKVKCSLRQLVVGAGLAGLHLPDMLAKMESWQHPFHSMYLTTDIHTANLGAHKGNNGAVIILGTGFSALSEVNGEQHGIGGYGFPINANSSGSWFGLEIIKAVLLDHDDLGPRTSMTTSILAKEKILDLATRLNNAPPNEFAKFAPLVFEHAELSDEVAIQLIQQGAEFTNKVIQKLLQKGATQIAFVGGIASHIYPWLDSKLIPYIHPPIDTAEFGAMLYAKQNHYN